MAHICAARSMPAWHGTVAWNYNHEPSEPGVLRLQQWGAPPEHVEGQVGAMQLRHVVLKWRERDANHLGLLDDLLLGASRARRRLDSDSASHDGSHAGLNDLAASATEACCLGYPREAREEDDKNDRGEARHDVMTREWTDAIVKVAGGVASGYSCTDRIRWCLLMPSWYEL